MAVVKFIESKKDGSPMVFLNGKVSFPERSGVQPEVGGVWEVEISGQNPKGTVNFLRLLKKLELYEWSWDDQRGNRGRMPACLIITPQGDVYQFTGQDIEGVVRVVNSSFTKQGPRWSHTIYSCISPEGTKIYSWRQSWGEGVFWPQSSWEEAIATVQEVAPQVKPDLLEMVIRKEWLKAAEKFDENREVMESFAKESGGETMTWSWNDGIASRSRRPACLIITPQGDVYRFTGQDIEGVVRVTKKEKEENGKWSNTTYHCISPAGTVVHSWRQDWDKGVFWPEKYWEEAIATVQTVASHALSDEVEAVIRKEWPRVAERFDETRSVVQSIVSQTASSVDHFIEWGDMADVIKDWVVEIISGDPNLGVGGIQENILLPGNKPLLAINIGPGGGKRYRFEKIAEKGIVRLQESCSRPYTRERVLAMVESQDWLVAWTEYKDGEITSYVLANKGGIHRLFTDGEVQSTPWKDMECTQPPMKEFEEIFGKIENVIPAQQTESAREQGEKEVFNTPFSNMLAGLKK